MDGVDGDVNMLTGGIVSDTESATNHNNNNGTEEGENQGEEERNDDDHDDQQSHNDSSSVQGEAPIEPQPQPQQQQPSIEESQNPAVASMGGDSSYQQYPPNPQGPQQQQQQQHPYPPPAWLPPQQPVPPSNPALLHFYEAQMRDHAAAYASAAAGAAWAAAQIAADIQSVNNSMTTAPHHNHNVPRMLPAPPNMFPMMMPSPSFHNSQQQQQQLPMSQQQQPPPYFEQQPYPLQPQMAGEVPFSPNNYGNANQYSSCGGSVGAGSAEESSYGYRRRKRQQRMPPSAQQQQQQNRSSPSGLHHQNNNNNNHNNHHQSNEKRGCRRRVRNDNSSSGGDQQQNINNMYPNNRRRARKMALASSSSDGGSASQTYKKKQRQPSDESLLGKTGVSALYEWCGKRRTTPTFALKADDDEDEEGKQRRLDVVEKDFEMSVSIDGMEWGRGRGRTKSAAKQEAARRALQVLLPGVVFDEASGILIKLPSTSNSRSKASTAACLEDLAPNLAKQLAIGHTNEDHEEGKSKDKEKNTILENTKKRSKIPHVYPGSTTTSEEEDENAYYASRGASVCSALLHAMVQIDERIPEAPVYTYQVSTLSPADRSSTSQVKRKSSLSQPIVVHRGSFTCTATMRLQKECREDDSPGASFETLEAVGIGGTKREARHTASARLLALLFPECEGMVQVKQAAEAAREKYAASKALKQQSKRESSFTNSENNCHNYKNDERPNLDFALASSECPPLPLAIQKHLLSAIRVPNNGATQPVVDHGEDRKLPAKKDESSLARQLSRQNQLDDRINGALQKLNEHDEEGRSLPDELTVDDVGRTVLRRATPEDIHWIDNLLDPDNRACQSTPALSPISVLGSVIKGESEDCTTEMGPSPAALRLWSSSTIVLLLCRVIAPYEDPPLGCAALTLGFSLEKGELLHIAQIASEPHLPRERFVECLQSFASCMKCTLETSLGATNEATTFLRQGELTQILNSHFPTRVNHPRTSFSDTASQVKPRPREEALVVHSPLQSVQEESEGAENSCDSSAPGSSAENRLSKKEGDKPSKRSRVQ